MAQKLLVVCRRPSSRSRGSFQSAPSLYPLIVMPSRQGAHTRIPKAATSLAPFGAAQNSQALTMLVLSTSAQEIRVESLYTRIWQVAVTPWRSSKRTGHRSLPQKLDPRFVFCTVLTVHNAQTHVPMYSKDSRMMCVIAYLRLKSLRKLNHYLTHQSFSRSNTASPSLLSSNCITGHHHVDHFKRGSARVGAVARVCAASRCLARPCAALRGVARGCAGLRGLARGCTGLRAGLRGFARVDAGLRGFARGVDAGLRAG